MNENQPEYPRILAIAPSTTGFGFALFEGQETLVNWGTTGAKGDKNKQCLSKVKEMIDRYQPGVMVLQDCSAKDSRRSVRIRKLSKQIIALATKHNVSVALFSREQLKQIFFANGEGTKHALAEIIAQRFPEELGLRLPPKRKLWKSEDSRMAIFDAVALALALRLQKAKYTGHAIRSI